MDTISRRTVLESAAVGLLAVAGVRGNESGDPSVVLDPVNPQPVRGDDGGNILGPINPERQAQGPDITVPPSTDHGKMPNLKYSFADAHIKVEPGGWSREVTQRDMPIAASLAGVNMRLKTGAVRELHWHTAAEWAFMIAGTARITAIDTDGNLFVEDVKAGDLWYFPAGVPHSIQGLEDSSVSQGGCEFLLVFDDGNFSEDSTFLLSDWLARTPREVVAKNFGVAQSELTKLPPKELFIFPVPLPQALEVEKKNRGAKPTPANFKFQPSDLPPIKAPGGTVRIVDSKTFSVSTNVSAAIVEVEPGGMREMHWHPNADEWQYYLSGEARMTVFPSGNLSRTFNYRGGDVGYVPFAMGHYVENIGKTPLKFIEVFKSNYYADFSLTQWMALTPPTLVQGHLHVSSQMLANLPTAKQVIVKG